MSFPSLATVAAAGDAGSMFSVHCPSHGTEVLLSLQCITVVNTADGVAVAWRCPCGHEGIELVGERPLTSVQSDVAVVG